MEIEYFIYMDNRNHTISISEYAHDLISKEIEKDRKTPTANKKSFGNIVDDMCRERYSEKEED